MTAHPTDDTLSGHDTLSGPDTLSGHDGAGSHSGDRDRHRARSLDRKAGFSAGEHDVADARNQCTTWSSLS